MRNATHFHATRRPNNPQRLARGMEGGRGAWRNGTEQTNIGVKTVTLTIARKGFVIHEGIVQGSSGDVVMMVL